MLVLVAVVSRCDEVACLHAHCVPSLRLLSKMHRCNDADFTVQTSRLRPPSGLQWQARRPARARASGGTRSRRPWRPAPSDAAFSPPMQREAALGTCRCQRCPCTQDKSGRVHMLKQYLDTIRA
jgi:hypothetical protein